MPAIHITDIEAAINHWRERKPSPDGVSIAEETRALADIYATMVWHHQSTTDEHSMPDAAYEAWLAW